MYQVTTILYYEQNSQMIQSDTDIFEVNPLGRIVIPESYKEDKSIVAVCFGEVDIQNRFGDR